MRLEPAITMGISTRAFLGRKETNPELGQIQGLGNYKEKTLGL